MTDVVVPLLVIALLIVMNGVFVAAEFAIVAARSARLDPTGGGWAVRYLHRILSHTAVKDRHIAIAQLGITLATIGLGMYGEPSIAGWIYGPIERALGVSEAAAHTLGTVLAVLVMTYFHVVVGEMIPKALALQRPEGTALAVSPLMRFTGMVLYPLVALVNGAGNAVLRLLRIPLTGESRLHSASELVHLVEESSEEGVVSEEEERLIRNILDFGELEVRDVMVPRVRVDALLLDAGADEVRRLVAEHGHTRFPVHRGDLDEIVGILHVKDFIERDVLGGSLALRSLVRRVPRVPEAIPVERLLASFKRLHVHMAIVLDEHGGTSGIVTLDDLLAEVVGEVDDDFDADEPPDVEDLGDGRFLVDGGMPLHRFNERFSAALDSERSTTLAGIVLERMQRVPAEGDEAIADGFVLRVHMMEDLAIRRLVVERRDRLEEP